MPPGFRRRHGRGGPGGYPQRIQRFAEAALLLLLHMRPTHGYGLMEGLQEIGFGDYPLDSSVVYRTLRHLEHAGLVTSDWDTESTSGPPRRVYRLTEAGDHYLAAWVADLRATDEVLHGFLEAYDGHMQKGKGEHHK